MEPAITGSAEGAAERAEALLGGGHMSGINLEAFTGEEGGRWLIAKPWVSGPWRYATDGRIVVRLPAVGEPDTDDTRLSGKLVLGADMYEDFDGSACTDVFPRMGPKAVDEVACPQEHVSLQSCDRCHGRGECDRCDCERVHDCGYCDGTGKRERTATEHPKTCECGGTGKIQVSVNEFLGGRLFSSVLLEKIRSELQDVYSYVNAAGLLMFRARGGVQGILAPIRPRDGEGRTYDHRTQ